MDTYPIVVVSVYVWHVDLASIVTVVMYIKVVDIGNNLSELKSLKRVKP